MQHRRVTTTGATLLPLKLQKKGADPSLIEHFYRELMLIEPLAQLGYDMKLVLNGPRCIPLFVQLLGKGVGVGGQWPLEPGSTRLSHDLSPCDTGHMARASR